jgi:hypothetical protein
MPSCAADTAEVVITPHVLVGALAGRGRAPRNAALYGLATHLVLDAVPHTDYALRGVRGALKLAADATIAGVTLAALRPDGGALAGAAAALAPDVHAQLGPRFLPGQALHRAAHHKRPVRRGAGWLVQAAVCALAVSALARAERS